jgi:hypothetical protein
MNDQIIGTCISEFQFEGLICSCGKFLQFIPELNLWNNQVINCECKEKYLAFLNGFAYPVVFKNKNWIKFEGQVIQKIIKRSQK